MWSYKSPNILVDRFAAMTIFSSRISTAKQAIKPVPIQIPPGENVTSAEAAENTSRDFGNAP